MLATPPHDKSFRLLIVDSVAAVFRDVGDDPGVAQYAQRSSLFFQVPLHRFAVFHKRSRALPLLCLPNPTQQRAGLKTLHICCLQIAALLRRYAEAYNLAVVVTNQVTDFFEDGDDAADRKVQKLCCCPDMLPLFCPLGRAPLSTETSERLSPRSQGAKTYLSCRRNSPIGLGPRG